MKKIITIFAFIIVSLGSVVSAFALPMPDLSGVEVVERVGNDFIYNCSDTMSNNIGLSKIFSYLKDRSQTDLLAINSNINSNSKCPIFYVYSPYSNNGFKLIVKNGKPCICDKKDSFIGCWLTTFFSDGSSTYTSYELAKFIEIEPLIFSCPSFIDDVSCVEDFFVRANFDNLIFKSKASVVSFTPELKSSVPDEPPKPVEPPKIPQQSSDYVPFDTSCLLDFFTSVKATSYSIVISGIGLFGLFLGFSIIPRTIRKFTKG